MLELSEVVNRWKAEPKQKQKKKVKIKQKTKENMKCYLF